MSDVRAFAEAFFAHFGARAFPLDDNLVVDLPPDLTAAFGKERLYLVFADDGVRRELSPVEDLVVYGSRTFDRMLALLSGRGEVTVACLPARFDPDHAPLPLHNCLAIKSQVETGYTPYYVVNYRAVYLSDEKREEFLTVVLDADGRPRPDKVGEVTSFASLVGYDDDLENLDGAFSIPPSPQPSPSEGEGAEPSPLRGEGRVRGEPRNTTRSSKHSAPPQSPPSERGGGWLSLPLPFQGRGPGG